MESQTSEAAGGLLMNKITRYVSMIASAAGILTVMIAGTKLADHNYDVLPEGIVIGA